MPFSAFVEADKRGDFMSIPRQVTRPNHSARSLARGLGWFSIGLGVVQLLAPRQVSRFIGMPGSEGMIRACGVREIVTGVDRKSTRLNSSHVKISYAVFCLKKKKDRTF